MFKVDNIDRKILAQLDRDARLADTQIAKAVGTSKQVVNYRINKLEEAGVIENYYALVNVGDLGYDTYYVYLQFSGINRVNEEQLLKKIRAISYVCWLISGVGRWDAAVLIVARSVSQFNERLAHLEQMCSPHIHDVAHTALLSAEHVNYKFLRSNDVSSVKVTPGKKIRDLDEDDLNMLRVLDKQGRIPVTELATQVGQPLHVTHYRLKKLVSQKIIAAFKPKIDVSKLGYQWHLLLVRFTNVSLKRKEEFVRFCRSSKAVYYVTTVVGPYNLMLDIHVENGLEFREVLFSLKDRFGDVIQSYESMLVFEELKISYFTS